MPAVWYSASLYAGGLIIPPLHVKGGCGCFPRASHTPGESAFLGRTIFVCKLVYYIRGLSANSQEMFSMCLM